LRRMVVTRPRHQADTGPVGARASSGSAMVIVVSAMHSSLNR
jgi:hypothetical protein